MSDNVIRPLPSTRRFVLTEDVLDRLIEEMASLVNDYARLEYKYVNLHNKHNAYCFVMSRMIGISRHTWTEEQQQKIDAAIKEADELYGR